MRINEFLDNVNIFIQKPIVTFNVDMKLFNQKNYRKLYNEKIREKVQDKFGIYIWADSQTQELFYIGKAGTIKNDGSFGNHTLKKRLIATRGKNEKTKKDILTNDYVRDFMLKNRITSLNFYVIYTLDGISPTYVESILLNEFYKQNKYLPILNNSF